jgi:hypothetical protein
MTPIDVARAIAAKRHAKPGVVEIDPRSEIAVIPGGIWVAAWLFVSTDDINAELASEYMTNLRRDLDRDPIEKATPCTI